MAGIYVHIPFCKQLCYYCDFYFKVSLEKKEAMVAALLKELGMQSGFLEGEPVETLYFGGGTPSVCSADEIARLVDRVRHVYGVGSFKELTLEANPEDLTPEYLSRLHHAGIDRLSIGIQSFVDRELKFMNRRHDAQGAERAVKAAQDAGVSNISIDLIYGLPVEGGQQWGHSLEKAMSLDVPHLSAYHLGIEPATVFGRRAERGVMAPVPEQVSGQHYALLEKVALAHGYCHYEISNFARPGCEAVHNSNYWRGVPYLGIGPSAHSFRERVRRWNVAGNDKYLAGIDAGAFFEEEALSERDRINECVMVSLRTSVGVDVEVFAREFGLEQRSRLLAGAVKYVERGVLELEDGFLRIPTKHFLVSDRIISDLFLV